MKKKKIKSIKVLCDKLGPKLNDTTFFVDLSLIVFDEFF